MQIKVHTQGWRGSQPVKAGEEAGALFSGLLEIDGQIYDRVNDILVKFGDEFATVNVTLIPSNVQVVNHDEDSWKKVCHQAEARERQAAASRGADRTISVYVSPNPHKENE